MCDFLDTRTVLGDDAVFISVVANHAVVGGTSFWHFYNTWAALCRGASPKLPDFRCNFFGESTAVLRFAGGVGPAVPLTRTRPFARESSTSAGTQFASEISSFQSLCAQIWISTTRARKQLDADATTTLRLAVNCRHRLRPAVSPAYFGNAIQSAPRWRR
ncbi:putative acetyltransferase [Hordeum vulgare]|nr:putative acetyltransferase [Hordeum vulgare]